MRDSKGKASAVFLAVPSRDAEDPKLPLVDYCKPTRSPYRPPRARECIDAGLVEEEHDFDDERECWSAEQVWEAIQRLFPMPSDPVIAHGEFSPGNILMLDGEVVGCIDAGRVGIADRYQYHAILWHCLGRLTHRCKTGSCNNMASSPPMNASSSLTSCWLSCSDNRRRVGLILEVGR